MRYKILLSSIALASLASCSSTPEVNPKAESYRISTTRNAPDEIYYRIRTARPPEVTPGPSAIVAPRIEPIFELALENDSLCVGALALAHASRYESYCASGVGARKITLHRLGTVDELAEAIAKEGQIKVVVDHENREIRFLANQGS